MPSDATPSTENQSAPLSISSTLARLAGTGVVILLVVGGFLYLGGWFSPNTVQLRRICMYFAAENGRKGTDDADNYNLSEQYWV